MYAKLGAAVIAVGVAFLANPAKADADGALAAGPAATPKQAVSMRSDSNWPYYGIAGMIAGAAAYFTDQGDGTIGGCIGLPGCTAATTTTTPTTTTTKTPTTTTTKTTTTTTTKTTASTTTSSTKTR